MIHEGLNRFDVLPLSFLKKSPYTGSKGSLRFRLEKTELPETDAEARDCPLSTLLKGAEEKKNPEGQEAPKTRTVLRCASWTTPFAFSETAPEDILISDFPFSDDGIEEALLTLNQKLKGLGKRFKQRFPNLKRNESGKE